MNVWYLTQFHSLSLCRVDQSSKCGGCSGSSSWASRSVRTLGGWCSAARQQSQRWGQFIPPNTPTRIPPLSLTHSRTHTSTCYPCSQSCSVKPPADSGSTLSVFSHHLPRIFLFFYFFLKFRGCSTIFQYHVYTELHLWYFLYNFMEFFSDRFYNKMGLKEEKIEWGLKSSLYIKIIV